MESFINRKSCPGVDEFFRGTYTPGTGKEKVNYYNGWTDKEINDKFVPYLAEKERKLQEYIAKKEAEKSENEARSAAEKKAYEEKLNSIQLKYGNEMAKAYDRGRPIVGMPETLFMERFNQRDRKGTWWFTNLKYESEYHETYYVYFSYMSATTHGNWIYTVWIDKTSQRIDSVVIH